MFSILFLGRGVLLVSLLPEVCRRMRVEGVAEPA
jgi:hypothetical protein